MKFTDIHDLDVRPGWLTVWRPAPRTPGATAPWSPDTRPPSYVQEAHLAGALASRSGPGGSPAWLAAVFELPGRLDPVALEAALLGWIDRHESLRSRLAPLLPDGPEEPSEAPGAGKAANAEKEPEKAKECALPVRRATLRAGAVSFARNVVGHFLDGNELTHRIERLFDTETDPLAWPSYVFATVGHTDSTTLYLGFDHSNVDGYSILLAAHEIHELYAAARDGVPARLDEAGSYLDFAALERRAAASVDVQHATVARWREYLTECGGQLPAFPSPVGPADEAEARRVDAGGTQRGGSRRLLDAAGTRAFDAACRAGGGHVPAGVLAVLALAGRTAAGLADFRVLTPFHTRNRPQWTQSVGWYVGLAPIGFPLAESDAFPEALARAAGALRHARHAAEVPFARVTELLGVSVQPRFVVSYVDMRQVPGARRWPEWKAAAVRSRRDHAHEVYLWINRTFDGLYVSFRYPDTARGRSAVPAYIDCAARQMHEVAATGSREEVLTPC
ncbi:condensation domain-containing protein [Streptomyces johnsoniae]|uniref:Condensation domain-containing protein n=1 Tax=Streptomyces johnsoniae TaxID=3075532 RepID=A0ABU2S3I0_9ACTN|nr:condensation domain-containing protein [Streptomyces sp. DSM 41886]MDT0443537.1 condensation domain-containing protein [Streptomyces sp. DSM 41886]